MFAGKPIIGISGGIGSGKSFVARAFGEAGCLVIDSDAQVRAAYELPAVRAELRRWWGDGVFNPAGAIDRMAVARRVFADPAERTRLEHLLHPVVDGLREEVMRAAADDPQIVAFVWDTPLLFEAGLHERCDAIVFVEAPAEVRLKRVRETRGWDATEWERRENLQWPLDTKREMSHDVVTNTADADDIRRQVRQVLSRILTRSL